MPIDPSIPLQVKPPAIDNPVESYGKILSLSSLMQGQQLQKAQLAQTQMENEAKQLELNSQQAMMKAFSETAPQPNEDPSQFQSRLLKTAEQHGALPKDLIGLQNLWLDRDTKLSQIEQNDLNILKFKHDQLAGAATTLLAVPEDQPDVYQSTYEGVAGQLMQDGTIKPGMLPEKAPSRSQVQAILNQALGGKQAIEFAFKNREVAAQEQGAGARKTAADLAQDRFNVEKPGIVARGQINTQEAALTPGQRASLTPTEAGLAMKAAAGDKQAQAALSQMVAQKGREATAESAGRIGGELEGAMQLMGPVPVSAIMQGQAPTPGAPGTPTSPTVSAPGAPPRPPVPPAVQGMVPAAPGTLPVAPGPALKPGQDDSLPIPISPGSSILMAPSAFKEGKNEAILQGLNPGVQSTVRAMVEGRLQWPGSMALRSGYWQAIIGIAGQYDPNFNSQAWQTRAATWKAFTSGKEATQLNNMNAAVDHLREAAEAAAGLRNTFTFPGSKLGRQVYQKVREKAGSYPALKSFREARDLAVGELNKAYVGGQGAVADRIRALSNLTEDSSNEEFNAVFREIGLLAADKLGVYRDQFATGLGIHPEDVKLLSPKREIVLNALSSGKAVGNKLTDQPAPAPAVQSPAPVSSGPAPGTIQKGYKFKGGNPADSANWEKVN